jgi:hypothetical protein
MAGIVGPDRRRADWMAFSAEGRVWEFESCPPIRALLPFSRPSKPPAAPTKRVVAQQSIPSAVSQQPAATERQLPD